MSEKQRLDVYLVENNYFTSRSLAQDAINENRVKVDSKIISKSSFKVVEGIVIDILECEHSFASRGGNKLYDALNEFKIDLKDKIIMDIGASTGGFSDVCLQLGASYVYAIDSGRDQLIDRLKQNPKIKNMEGINCRYLKKEMFDKSIDFVCMDVSFISIKLIIDAILSVVEEPYNFVFLIKPQFEVGKSYLGKNGIVKDKKIHKKLLEEFILYFKEKQLGVEHLCRSHTVGRDGNQEYLIHLSNIPNNKYFDILKIVKGEGKDD